MSLGVFCMGCVYVCKELQILMLFFRSTYANFVFPFGAVALQPKTSRPQVCTLQRFHRLVGCSSETEAATAPACKCDLLRWHLLVRRGGGSPYGGGGGDHRWGAPSTPCSMLQGPCRGGVRRPPPLAPAFNY